MQERALGPQEKYYDQGEGFLYLGNTYPIQISQDASIEQDNAIFEGDKLHIYVAYLLQKLHCLAQYLHLGKSVLDTYSLNTKSLLLDHNTFPVVQALVPAFPSVFSESTPPSLLPIG